MKSGTTTINLELSAEVKKQIHGKYECLPKDLIQALEMLDHNTQLLYSDILEVIGATTPRKEHLNKAREEIRLQMLSWFSSALEAYVLPFAKQQGLDIQPLADIEWTLRRINAPPIYESDVAVIREKQQEILAFTRKLLCMGSHPKTHRERNSGRPKDPIVQERRKMVKKLAEKGMKPGEIAAKLRVNIEIVKSDLKRM